MSSLPLRMLFNIRVLTIIYMRAILSNNSHAQGHGMHLAIKGEIQGQQSIGNKPKGVRCRRGEPDSYRLLRLPPRTCAPFSPNEDHKHYIRFWGHEVPAGLINEESPRQNTETSLPFSTLGSQSAHMCYRYMDRHRMISSAAKYTRQQGTAQWLGHLPFSFEARRPRRLRVE
jgi:hypothetical protein